MKIQYHKIQNIPRDQKSRDQLTQVYTFCVKLISGEICVQSPNEFLPIIVIVKNVLLTPAMNGSVHSVIKKTLWPIVKLEWYHQVILKNIQLKIVLSKTILTSFYWKFIFIKIYAY